ncbi:hypothetical protein HYS00_01770 [Candidatus Microgenomates bacterium]|nr:hypothetical protein [Candidatus Microgenomates bacterium]
MNPKYTKFAIFAAAFIVIVLIAAYISYNRNPPKSPEATVPFDQSPNVKLDKVMKTQLPIQNANVDIAYSRLLKKFFIYKKTRFADQIVQDFLKKNQLENIAQGDMIIYVNKPALQQMFAEEKRLFPAHPDTQEIDY